MSGFNSMNPLVGTDINQPLTFHSLPSTSKRSSETQVDNVGSEPKRRRNQGDETIISDDGAARTIDTVALPDTESANSSAVMHVAERLLFDKFGHRAFLHEQKEAIERILSGRNVLTIFPTGAGKSVCYQLPAVAFKELDLKDGSKTVGKHGITIVVSPLIALMKDRVDKLKRQRIAADCIDSTKTPEERRRIYKSLEKGSIRLLYCSPERLSQEHFITKVQQIPGGVRLLVIGPHAFSGRGLQNAFQLAGFIQAALTTASLLKPQHYTSQLNWLRFFLYLPKLSSSIE